MRISPLLRPVVVTIVSRQSRYARGTTAPNALLFSFGSKTLTFDTTKACIDAEWLDLCCSVLCPVFRALPPSPLTAGCRRRLLLSIVRMLPQCMDTLLLLASLVVFYGILGVVMFRDIGVAQEESEFYFSTVPQAFMQLMILLTTANYPGTHAPCIGRVGLP